MKPKDASAAVTAKRSADKVSALQAKLSEEKARNRELTKMVELQADRLGRTPKVFHTSPKKSRRGKQWARVILPDLHGYAADAAAVAAALADCKKLNPREVVLLGDVIDCGGFLAQHHTLSYVAETAYTFEDDVAAANKILDELQAAAPGATIHFIEGNHERRVEKWCVNQTLRNKADSEFLRRMFGVPTLLHVKERGLHYYAENVRHMGLAVPGTIKLGDCYFTHGSSTAKNAADAMLTKFAACVVFGHTHRKQAVSKRTMRAGEIAAWNPGCLCELQPMWQNTNPTDWTHGYGLQVCYNDGSFWHVNVPIIDGVSYLELLTRRF